MTNCTPSVQKARKTASRTRPSPSLAIISTALSEVPLPKRVNGVQNNAKKGKTPTVSKISPHSRKTEQPSTRGPSFSSSVSSARISSDTTPSLGARRGEIDDICYKAIVELFVMRYIQNFNKDRLALENAYIPEATFSCRFISSSCFPSPYHFTKCNTGTLRGPSSIAQALSSFSRRIVFVPPAETALDVTIDILRLPDMNYFVALNFDTTIEAIGVSVDMVFLLKDNTRLTGKQDPLKILWAPFVVMSHQIILRS